MRNKTKIFLLSGIAVVAVAVLCVGILWNVFATKTFVQSGAYFVENSGQAPAIYKYYYSNEKNSVYFEQNKIVFRNFYKSGEEARENVYHMKLLNISNDVNLVGDDLTDTKVNYFIGDESAHGVGVSAYEKLIYENVYDGIDLVFKFDDKAGSLKSEYLVAPSVDISKIAFQFEGTDGLDVKDGDLVVHTKAGDFSMQAPYVYQVINGENVEVSSSYKIINGSNYTVGFDVSGYDVTKELIIDPILTELSVATYLGGTGAEYTGRMYRAVDGSIYVTGNTYSNNFPTAGIPYDSAISSSGDAFISKFSSDLTSLVASTYLGGNDIDGIVSIGISGGSIYVVGDTRSSDFPTAGTPYDSSSNDGILDVFVSKFTTDLSTLQASTYLGGTGLDMPSGMRFDASGNVVITGGTSTGGADFPTTAGAYQEVYGGGGTDIFVSKLDSGLSNLVASTYIGGATGGDNRCEGYDCLEIDGSGNIYIIGNTNSSDYPTTLGAYDTSLTGTYDMVVSKFSSDLTSLVASTYLGGWDGFGMGEYSLSIALDASGNVYVAGETESTTFPMVGTPYDDTSVFTDEYDAVVAKFNSGLTSLTASTYLGGAGAEAVTDIVVDSSGLYLVGGTTSADFPTVAGAYDQSSNGDQDIFISRLSADLSTLAASTLIGTAGTDYPTSAVLDDSNNFYVLAYSNSAAFPVTVGAYDQTQNGSMDAVVAILNYTNSAPAIDAGPAFSSQSTTGNGYVTFTTTVSDTDSDDTKLKVEYSDDNGVTWYDPDLVSATPASGTVDLDDSNAYQIGTVDAIDTSGGAKALTVVWDTLSASNGNGTLDGTDQTDIKVRVTANDGTIDSTATASVAFEVDDLDPSGLGSFVATPSSTTVMGLTWTAATEANFNYYEIFYGTNQADVQNRDGTALSWDTIDDADLATATTADTSITGLSANVQYYFKIWAVDDYGDEATIADISKYTLAAVPGTPTVVASSSTVLNVVIDNNSNPAGTEFAILVGAQYVQADGSLGVEGTALWQTKTVWGGALGYNVSVLTPNTSYVVGVKARNGNSTATTATSAAAKYTLAAVPVSGSVSPSTCTVTCSVSLGWGADGNPGTTTYYVLENGSALTSTTGVSVSSSLATAGTYTYGVYAKNGDNVVTSTLTLGSVTASVAGGGPGIGVGGHGGGGGGGESPATPSVGLPAEPSVEAPIVPSAEPSVEPPVEPSIETPIESSVEPPVTPLVEPPATPSVEPPVESLIEPPIVPLIEPPVIPWVESLVTFEAPVTSVTPSIVVPASVRAASGTIRTKLKDKKADDDNDGFSNEDEIKIYKTDPFSADTDGDGLSDRLEIQRYGTKPAISDTDGDGVSDGAEIKAGTNPLIPDATSDDLSKAEGALAVDTDGNGLSDEAEKYLKPAIPDGKEIAIANLNGKDICSGNEYTVSVAGPSGYTAQVFGTDVNSEDETGGDVLYFGETKIDDSGIGLISAKFNKPGTYYVGTEDNGTVVNVGEDCKLIVNSVAVDGQGIESVDGGSLDNLDEMLAMNDLQVPDGPAYVWASEVYANDSAYFRWLVSGTKYDENFNVQYMAEKEYIESQGNVLTGYSEPGTKIVIAFRSATFASVVLADKNDGHFEVKVPESVSKEKGAHVAYVYSVDDKSSSMSPVVKTLFKIVK